MTTEFEQKIMTSKFAELAQDDQYALELFTALAESRFLKRSFNPFAKKDEVNYNKRQAAVVIANLRNNETFYQWYLRDLAPNVSESISEEFKKLGWTMVKPI